MERSSVDQCAHNECDTVCTLPQKRIKRVFTSHDQVLHLWANQSQGDARCKNVYFNGKSCYSYGRHYELGRLVEFNGHTVALINDAGYSVTTNKHIHSAWAAVEHLPRIKNSDLHGSGNSKVEIKKLVFEGLLKTQDGLINDLFNQFNGLSYSEWSSEFRIVRSRGKYGMDDPHWTFTQVNRFNSLCETLGFKDLALDIDWHEYKALFEAHATLRMEREKANQSPEMLAKRELERQKREARNLAKIQDKIQEWRQGGTAIREIRDLHPQIIRVVGDQVQTSRGASVPLSHAQRLLRMVKKGSAKSGEPVGSFAFSSIIRSNPSSHDGGELLVRIGCHTIALSEAESVLGAIEPKLSLVGSAE